MPYPLLVAGLPWTPPSPVGPTTRWQAYIHAIAVERAIRAHFPGFSPVIIDGADFPLKHTLSICKSGWEVKTDSELIRSIEIRSVWWRRPGTHKLDPGIKDAGVRQFSLRECTHAFDIIASYDTYLVVNRIEREFLATRKPYQLFVADKFGLKVPEYCITNDTAEFDRLVGSERQLVFKTMSAPTNTFGETRSLTKDMVDLRRNISVAPTIFQHGISRKAEFRVTIIGDETFVHEIVINNPAVKDLPDWRLDVSAQSVNSHLPKEILEKTRAMLGFLKLDYGAFDFIEDVAGDVYFLEVNPHGQFLFNEADTRAPMALAMAKLLTSGLKVR